MPVYTLEKPEANADYYERRLRRAIVPMHVIEALLSLDGKHTYKMEGWPDGAKIVGAHIQTKPFSVLCFLYHPEFPIVPHGALPSLIKVTARRVN